MKKYIERYIYSVTKRLPESQRLDVKKDLEANIYDMLDGDESDEHVDQVLHELGNPRLVADNYLGEQRFVIDPVFYTDYVTTLKIVLIIVGVLSLFFNALDALLNIDADTFWQAFGQVIERILDGIFSSLFGWFAIITLIFWGMSRPKAKAEILSKWKLKDLPDVQKEEKVTLNRIGVMIEIVLTTILSLGFIILILFYVDRIGWYQNGVLVQQIFDQHIINQMIPLFIASFIINIFTYLLKLKNGRYTTLMMISYTLSNILSTVAILVMINQSGFILDAFVNYAAIQTDTAVSEITSGIGTGIRVLTIIGIVGTVLDLATNWRKLYKTTKKEA